MNRIIVSERVRSTCGVWMPKAQAYCARRPGHGTEHRSAYSMDNLRARRAGPTHNAWRCPSCGRAA